MVRDARDTHQEKRNVIKNEIKGHIEENDGDDERKKETHKKERATRRGLKVM